MVDPRRADPRRADPRVALLTRHFLRRFADNDLISPHADRHEVLTAIVTLLISSGLFMGILLTVKYLFIPFQTPGMTSIAVLDDRAFLLGCTMTVMALVAVAQWDALSLDARDASVLGPLPVPRGLLVRTKLTALALFAAAFAFGSSIIPSVVHPAFVAARLPVGIVGGLRLMIAQAVTNLAAGACGFLAVLALREVLRAVLGEQAFRRVSAVLQAALVLLLVTIFLLIPALSSGVARRWLEADARWVPPLWFVGMQETLAGDVIDRLPRPVVPPRIARAEAAATVQYRRVRPVFAELGGLAVTALAALTVLAIAAFLWNSRRLPAPGAVRRPSRGGASRARASSASGYLRNVLAGRHPVSRAGFLFARRALTRSASHRVTVMAAAAVGIAVSSPMLRGVELGRAASVDVEAIKGVLAVQLVMVVTVLAGFRHALRVPAELRANWSLQLAWPGEERRYLIGVKRAAVAILGLPLFFILVPLHVLTLGPGAAAVHFLFGLLVMLVGLELTTIGLLKPPFASTYAPGANMKVVGAALAPLVLIVIHVITLLEGAALRDARGSAMLLGGTLLVWGGLRALDMRRRERQRETGEPVDWDEIPSSAPRMDLSG